MLNVLHPLSAAHEATDRGPQFPATRAQLAHSIISKLDKPLVNVNEIQHHLDLLAVFHKVHHAVQDRGVVVDPSDNSPVISARQALFLGRAQHRFETWIKKVLQRVNRDSNSSLSVEEIPPVDVLMFLHAYMLNPLSYYEDSMRVYPCLSAIGSFPWKEVHALIDVSNYELVPTPEQVSLWESLTCIPFEIPLETTSTDPVGITCPRCLVVCDHPWVKLLGIEVNQDSSTPCPECNLAIDSDALCVARFLKDASSSRSFARTILGRGGREDLESAHKISQAIKDMLDIPNAIESDRFEWKMANIEAKLLKNTDSDSLKYRIQNILDAYSHSAQSSIDIKAAVMRQARFIATMHDIHWAGENSTFNGKEAALMSAIARYHQYFALSSEISVPALDIDLIFHTHQLSGRKYIKDCLNILGSVLDHDDSVPVADINNALPQSVDVWEDFYNTPYLTTIPPLFQPATAPPCQGGIDCTECGGKNGHHAPHCSKYKK